MEILNIDMDEIYDNEDQLSKFQEEVTDMDALALNRLNYLVLYGVPNDDLKTMWTRCVRERSVQPLFTMFDAEKKSVQRFAVDRGYTSWHAVPPRYASTVHVVTLQGKEDVFPCDLAELVYDRGDARATAAREMASNDNSTSPAKRHFVASTPRRQRPRSD